MAEKVRIAFERYKKLVLNNPDKVGQVESVFKIFSYFVAGRFEQSQVLSELMYSASNILVLLNDAIYKQASKIVPAIPMSQARLNQMLTVLEYLEVFVEMAAHHIGGEPGRWVMITVLQIAKAGVRFFLLAKFGAGLQPVPPLQPIDRASVIKQKTEEAEQENFLSDEESNRLASKATFVLKRSGQIMRTLSASPPINMRTWQLPEQVEEEKVSPIRCYPATPLKDRRRWAEAVHIAKPLLHLASLYACGLNSWKPWLLSCGLDVTSLTLMGEPEDLNPCERAELRRRALGLLFYLLRSPFYDRYSQAKIIFMLRVISDNIPGMSLLLRPLMDYLPAWQKVYFYIWSM